MVSHPDIDGDGTVCFYADMRSGGRWVVLARDGRASAVGEGAGPLGPTMNHGGTVAFRAGSAPGGSGVFVSSGERATTIADTSGTWSAFHGLPVVDSRGAVVFRADLGAGGQGVYVGHGGTPVPIVESGEAFSDLGLFPAVNAAGDVAFCATRRDGGAGVFVASAGDIETVIDTSGAFESFRGALLDDAGRIVFYATPRGGELGIFCGPDPLSDRILGLGGPLLGSTIVDFALNPVSINAVGQVAIRVKLANQLQVVLRADPAPRSPARGGRRAGGPADAVRHAALPLGRPMTHHAPHASPSGRPVW